jgi:hypothetical protein
MATQGPLTRKKIILVAVIISIILYIAGVFSGLYANKIFKESTEKDFLSLKKSTEQDLDVLEDYVSLLDSSMKSMQLEQAFMETLKSSQMCSFSSISLEELFGQLSYYWDKLPFRLEEYEKYNKPSDEYNLLKQQYTLLSIRTWIIARNQYEKCNRDIVQGLYFYSADCDKCIEQGEQLDELNRRARALGKEMVMFPIDYNLNESIVINIKKYYGINKTPAIIVNDKVFQGRLFTAEELLPNRE